VIEDALAHLGLSRQKQKKKVNFGGGYTEQSSKKNFVSLYLQLI